MKKLSDYKGEDAFELWADLMEPVVRILQDSEVSEAAMAGKSRFALAALILKKHKEDAVAIFERIDPEPVDGLNLVRRIISLLADIGRDPAIGSFFGLHEPEMTESDSTGSATASTEDGEK